MNKGNACDGRCTQIKEYRTIIILSSILLALILGILIMRLSAQADEPLPDTEPSAAATDTPSPSPSTSVSPSPSVTEAEESESPDPRALALLSGMSLEEKVYQLFITTPEGLTGVSGVTSAGELTAAALADKPVGGLVYFANNIQTREQTREMIAKTQEYSKIPLFISVDEEGGLVSRIASNPAMGLTNFSNMAVYGAEGDPDAVYDIGATIASWLLDLGFNLNFAPVADVLVNPENTAIGERAFSSDASVVAEMVSAFVRGSQEAGVIATLKHFPGHGGTRGDTHYGAVILDRELSELREVEFLPYTSGIAAGVEFIMVSHISVPLVTGDELPAEMSSYLLRDILRDELGFEGIIITDAQNMSAVSGSYSSGEAAVNAIAAGVDVILMPADLESAAAAVIAAVKDGAISVAQIDESVLRVLSVKYKYEIL